MEGMTPGTPLETRLIVPQMHMTTNNVKDDKALPIPVNSKFFIYSCNSHASYTNSTGKCYVDHAGVSKSIDSS